MSNRFLTSSVRIILALTLVVLLALSSRRWPVGWHPYDKSLGDVLYAVAVYLVLALIGMRPVVTCLTSFAICFAIELFQLTGFGARHGDFLLVRWLLGTTFSWHDVACYVIGVAFALALDVVLLRRSSPPS